MKNSLIIFISCLIMLCSCGKSENDTEKLICGVYVRSFEQQYAKGNDTLVIRKPDDNNNFYVIEHKTSYRQIINNVPSPQLFKTDDWTGIYDKETNVLKERVHGIILSFIVSRNVLLLGTDEYIKINN